MKSSVLTYRSVNLPEYVFDGDPRPRKVSSKRAKNKQPEANEADESAKKTKFEDATAPHAFDLAAASGSNNATVASAAATTAPMS